MIAGFQRKGRTVRWSSAIPIPARRFRPPRKRQPASFRRVALRVRSKEAGRYNLSKAKMCAPPFLNTQATCSSAYSRDACRAATLILVFPAIEN